MLRTVICAYCGKEYTTKAINSKFCCLQCRALFYKANPKKKEDKIVLCVYCGTEFVSDGRSNAKACSPPCRAALRKLAREAKEEGKPVPVKPKKKKASPPKSISEIIKEAQAAGFGAHYGKYVAFIEGRIPDPRVNPKGGL